MNSNEKKSAAGIMRALHRDVGLFFIGLALVYSLSGIILIHRDTGFLMRDVHIERKLPANLDPEELGDLLRLRGFQVEKTDGDIVHFRGGTYNKATGMVAYTSRELPFVLKRFVGFHKTISSKSSHWAAMLFGVLLAFLAVSSFWMYPKGSSAPRRGIILATAGVVVTVAAIFL